MKLLPSCNVLYYKQESSAHAISVIIPYKSRHDQHLMFVHSLLSMLNVAASSNYWLFIVQLVKEWKLLPIQDLISIWIIPQCHSSIQVCNISCMLAAAATAAALLMRVLKRQMHPLQIYLITAHLAIIIGCDTPYLIYMPCMNLHAWRPIVLCSLETHKQRIWTRHHALTQPPSCI